MFKIGDFAKLTHVSVRMLRHYDDLGLLKPAHIDPFTDYRYYSADQLPRLNRILALQGLGFTLKQIGEVLDGTLSTEQMRGMLKLKQAELAQQLAEDEARLARVAATIEMIDLEEGAMSYEVVLKPLLPVRTIATHATVQGYEDLGPVFERLFGDLMRYVLAHTRPSGLAFAWYHDAGEGRPFDVEAVIPVAEWVAATEAVRVRDLPAVPLAACLVHRGPFDQIGCTYQLLMAWIQRNGYQVAGDVREVYVNMEPRSDPSQYLTEIQIPVTKG